MAAEREMREALRRSAEALTSADDVVLDYIVGALASLTSDDDEDPVALVEATVGCALAPAEACAVRLAADELRAPVAEGGDAGAAPSRIAAPLIVVAARSAPPDHARALGQAEFKPSVGAGGCSARAVLAQCAPRGAADAAAAPSAHGATVEPPRGPRIAPVDATVLALLREMCPHVPLDVTEHVLRARCRGDKHEAAEYLLQMGVDELDALATQLERERARAAQADDAARRRERESKRSLVGRYEHVAVGGAAPPREPHGSARGKSERPAAEVRYRDGAVASVAKGQKFVVEDTRPEWDGGSRGTVKTKGKRGKGFA
ncbi:hypothetical protein KFE25_013412 [Diacronema lutheri]|uniref:CUE domain-containing protein n=1 Tax=Diacronema lutheri TaxID=2081491 RepID=A0A8J5XQD0_DIALT|nr:hypothetical protein KFE25_013412 [Diacronema lutheri]